ncbi:MAG: hypothetical protein ABIR08_03435 [Sphingomonas sp.]
MRLSFIALLLVVALSGCTATRPPQANIYFQLSPRSYSVDALASDLSGKFDASLSSHDELIPDADRSRAFELSSGSYELIIVQMGDIHCPPSGLNRITYNDHFYRIDVVAKNADAAGSKLARIGKSVSTMIVGRGGKVLAELPRCPNKDVPQS